MRGFTSRTPVAEVLQWLDNNVPQAATESVDLAAAAGRVLADSISSPINVPGFLRGMMDGFAVQAADTAGASSYNPLPLQIIGQSLPGEPFSGEVHEGQAVRIMTGAPVPAGQTTYWLSNRLPKASMLGNRVKTFKRVKRSSLQVAACDHKIWDSFLPWEFLNFPLSRKSVSVS